MLRIQGFRWLRLCAVGMLFCGMITVFSSCSSLTPREEMERFLAKNSDVLPQVLDEIKGRRIYRADAESESLKQLFRSGRLEAIDARDTAGDIYFEFSGTDFEIPEGDIDLVYIPSGKYTRYSEYVVWDLNSSTENSWRYAPIGIGDKGYIQLDRIQGNWFYEEVYYPT